MRSTTFALAASLIVVPLTAYAQGERWQVGTAPSFSSGTYGTGLHTHVFHAPVTVRRLFADADVTIVVPFTCVSGNGFVTIVDGTPVRTERTAATSTRRSGSTRVAAAPEAAYCGLGDVVVRGRYYVVDERGWLPTVAVRGHVKAPTASAGRGLGTGRPDEGIGIEISRLAGAGLVAMLDGGYTVIGEPDGIRYENNWWYEVGVGRDFANGRYNLSVFYAEDRALVNGLMNARELLAAIGLRGTQGWRFQASGQVGLSEGAPNHGVTLGASRRF